MNASSLADAQDILLLATKLYVPPPPRSNLVSRPRLIERLEGNVFGIAVIVELTYLNGRDKLAQYDVHSLVRYESE